MTSNENISALLAICAGNSPVARELYAQRPVMRSFVVLFDLHLNKRLSKKCRGWWLETPSSSTWRHCYVHLKYRPDKQPIYNALLATLWVPCMWISYFHEYHTVSIWISVHEHRPTLPNYKHRRWRNALSVPQEIAFQSGSMYWITRQTI